jgi:sigma-B regulation protein RsbU (phosphoserine phosphatase)
MAMVFLLGGPILGLLAGVLARGMEDQAASTALSEYVTERAAILKRETFVITEALYQTRSFFYSSKSVTREEFRIFTQDILERHPDISSVEWIPLVTAGERAAHEAAARAEGMAGYTIRAPNVQGKIQPAPAKADYYPIFYVEPMTRVSTVMGLDLSLDPARKSVLEYSIRNNQLAITDPITLMRAPSKGFLVVLPVYRRPPAANGAESKQLRGLIGVAIRARELFVHSLELNRRDANREILFELFDADVKGKPLLIASTTREGEGRHFLPMTHSVQIEIGDQRWVLTASPSEAFISSHRAAKPFALGIGVFLFWELLGGVTLVLTKQSHDKALRKQSLVYESAVRSLNEGVIVANKEGRFLLFNPAAEHILGVGLQEVQLPGWSKAYGCFYSDTVTPFPPEKLPLARALRGERVTEEIFIRNAVIPDGLWISSSGAPVMNEEGSLVGGVVTFRDISKWKKASESLRLSVKELKDLKYAVDQAAIVSIANLDGDILYVNGNFQEISGYSETEALGQNHRLLNSGYHPAAFFEELWTTIGSGREWRGVIQNRAKNGGIYWVDTTIVPLLNDAGQCERFLAISSDVTAGKLQEQEVLLLSNAVDQTADAVFITDAAGIISYVNPAFEKITGFSREDALGNTPRILKSGTNAPQYYEELWRTILAGNSFRSLTINRKKNGGAFDAEQTITPIKDSEGHIVQFVSVVKDITDRVMRERQDIEMRYAAQVQRQLYPAQNLHIQGYDIAGASHPAEFACGDYYDYMESQNGSLYLVLGDVSGHGLAPAMIMAATRSYLRFLIRAQSGLDEIMKAVNEVLFADLERSRFVALLLARIDVAARRLVYVNAGLTAGYVLDRTGAVKAELCNSGPPLGLLPDVTYRPCQHITLDPGDTVFLMTDGIVESRDKQENFFDPEGALAVVRAHLDEPAAQIVHKLYEAARKFSQNTVQLDDITAIVCKVDPGSEGRQ